MIIVNLMGGLGNQMFQYALGRRLALEHDIPLKLDISWFQHQEKRQFILNKLNIQAEIASEKEIYRIQNYFPNRYLRKGFLIFQSCLPYFKRRVVKEINAGKFDPNMLTVPRQCYLIGYWQCEKYFKSIEPAIREEFKQKEPLSGLDQQLAQEIQQNPHSVSVHVRRGDFISSPEINKYHGVCSLEYYYGAIKIIKNHLNTNNIKIFIFSDDPFWVKENLKFDYPTIYISHNDKNNVHKDLKLMSICNNHIIANSSLSWWGAWLSDYPNKKVIAPKKWFNDQNINFTDLIPESWIRI